MSCAIGGVRMILFFFNFVLSLCGLGLVIPGIIFHTTVSGIEDGVQAANTIPTIPLIIVGGAIFIVAFFGCCGAIRESHCMITTYAVLLLTILVIQVTIGVFAFVGIKDLNKQKVEETYQKAFDKYWDTTHPSDQTFIDFIQSNLECCGVESQDDFKRLGGGVIPWSCCEQKDMNHKQNCTASANVYKTGCAQGIYDFFKDKAMTLGKIACIVGVVEFIGVIFALCLANSIKNADRRAYRV
jgi:CD63 antigen